MKTNTHTRRRTVLLAAFAVLAAGSGALQLQGDVRDETQRAFETVLDHAKETYRARSGIDMLEQRSEARIDDVKKRLAAIAREKRKVRLRRAALRASAGRARERADGATARSEEFRKLSEQQRTALGDFLRESHLRQPLVFGGTSLILRRLVVASLSDDVGHFLRDDALSTARTRLLTSLVQSTNATNQSRETLLAQAESFDHEEASQAVDHERLLKEEEQLLREEDALERTLQKSETQLRAIKAETARVHRDVLALQSELATIDEHIRNRAERALIEKGLRSRFSRRSGNDISSVGFQWPVKGRVTAGFLETSYRRVMGIPHLGMDIAVPQGTAVTSAAEGVVFIVRDGGKTGYSYVLIGHRDGYATLYGHLSETEISAGQEVEQGDVIGKSGGMPGTHGAGPTTTGPHLHFEVIEKGTNVNPRSVLP